jgi:P-type E1-E2 ATPase
MIELQIPGRGLIQLEHLVCDVNGTLALDGQLVEGVSQMMRLLSDRLEIHLLTADTHGKQELIDKQLSLQAVRIQPGAETAQKAAYVQDLGAEHVIAIGQGSNDAKMLAAAGIGICIFSNEGTATETLLAADLAAPDIISALELLAIPMRLVASLRR